MSEAKETYHYTESGLDNVYINNVTVHRCSCGEFFASIPSVVKVNQVIALALIEKRSSLRGKEVKYLRKNAGLSAKVFAEHIGINKSTLSRWEHEKQIIDKANDRLIRLFYAGFKGLPHEEIQKLSKEVIKAIHSGGKEARINIPVNDIDFINSEEHRCS
jgi:putative zinc finger/helix-turn-helix YgiT family protein